MSTSNNTSLKSALAQACTEIESTIDTLLPMVPGDESVLLEAMRYAALGGGKRLRGFLAVEVASLFGADHQAALRVAASVEFLHAYSLVHDDLPSMDDDDLRRGRPSTHRQFDEAIAILAGDALQTRAFEVLVEPETSADATIRAELTLALARASGAAGMVGGQVIDIRGEGRALPLDQVRRLHALKTGALIRYAAEAGAILAGITDKRRDAIVTYGLRLGTAFQVADDVLDATASAEELGKTAGKDEASGKSTYVSLLGIDGARAEARRLSDEAREALSSFGAQAEALRALADYVVERRS
ncbi:polyprenyl synthetase family protein [Neokomagataea thailandica]|uniref:Geranylgeranyl pyrophosphate synthase n=1 Tax=Neokomagataea tanensis NBRC 106556 TaxID=1223519 RepID=A0ABQ0QH78_9PROT|nr:MULTISPECIES: farnesyl diphosphate synthase [Neokomagataea]GBR44719.1 geranylgeranyl pyrophosphate synthase [Neokomagataea tanensis NBRC 106556]